MGDTVIRIGRRGWEQNRAQKEWEQVWDENQEGMEEK